MKNYSVAVVGATGLVGRKMIQVLEERRFPISKILLLASRQSAGKHLRFGGEDIVVHELTKDSFTGTDIALFSAGATVSREFAPIATGAGALVIDNSSAFRMDDAVPLVVPEVNPHMIPRSKGIIANPNCSTIQMVVPLKPLHDKWNIKRIVVSTYQAVTGAGKLAVDQLQAELADEEDIAMKFPHRIAYNTLPQIDVFYEDGYSKEEHKMVDETRKILGDDSLAISATCVRVPVMGGHSESVNIEFHRPFDIDEVRQILGRSRGVCLQDDPARGTYPMPITAEDRDEVFVGRIRRDPSVHNGLNLWIVADNLRKGAATNAVQIAEEWIRRSSHFKD